MIWQNILYSILPAHPAIDRYNTIAPLRVLLADDDAVSQTVLQHLLHTMGHHIDVVANGQSVLHTLEQGSYDLVLLDVQMPDIDGLAVAQQICQRWSPAQRPYLIAVTANTSPGDREQCLTAGMDAYLSKPIDIEKLSDAIGKCRQHARQIPLAPPLDLAMEHPSPDMVDRTIGPAIDLQRMEKLRTILGESGEYLLVEIIDTYLADSFTLLATLRTAASHADAGALKQVAHKLKSSSSLLAALELAKLCHQIEQAANTGDISDYTEWVQQIEVEYMNVRAALTSMRHSVPSLQPKPARQ